MLITVVITVILIVTFHGILLRIPNFIIITIGLPVIMILLSCFGSTLLTHGVANACRCLIHSS